MDIKSFIIGIVIGILIVVATAAIKSESAFYQSAMCEAEGTCIYTVLNTRTGETRVIQINPARGHLVLQKALLSISGEGEWIN